MAWQSDLGFESLVYEENALLLQGTLLAYYLGDDHVEPRGGRPLVGIWKHGTDTILRDWSKWAYDQEKNILKLQGDIISNSSNGQSLKIFNSKDWGNENS